MLNQLISLAQTLIIHPRSKSSKHKDLAYTFFNIIIQGIPKFCDFTIGDLLFGDSVFHDFEEENPKIFFFQNLFNNIYSFLFTYSD